MTGDVPPGDIHPESGSRLPLPDREQLDEAARKIYDYFVDPKGGSYVGLFGPGGIRLHSPRLAEHTQTMNRYLRRESGIELHVRELSILVTARELDSQFEWTAHEPEALAAGITPEVVDIVKHRGSTEGLGETEAVIIELGRQIFGDHRVTPEVYARAVARFGQKGLVDLVAVMGNYAATAAILATFDVQLHDGWKPLLPIP